MKTAAAKSTTEEGGPDISGRLFFVALLDLSWRMAAAFLTPTILAAWISQDMEQKNLITLTGMIIGLIGAIIIIAKFSKKPELNGGSK